MGRSRRKAFLRRLLLLCKDNTFQQSRLPEKMLSSPNNFSECESTEKGYSHTQARSFQTLWTWFFPPSALKPQTFSQDENRDSQPHLLANLDGTLMPGRSALPMEGTVQPGCCCIYPLHLIGNHLPPNLFHPKALSGFQPCPAQAPPLKFSPPFPVFAHIFSSLPVTLQCSPRLRAKPLINVTGGYYHEHKTAEVNHQPLLASHKHLKTSSSIFRDKSLKAKTLQCWW